MSISLASISRGKARRAPRIILLGTDKVGKSSFAGQAPNPIFIPVIREEGIDEIDTSKFPTAKNFDEVIECLSSLCAGEHDHKTVVIDSASALEPLVWDKTCVENGGVQSIEKVGGGFGKGYIEALKYWRELQSALDYLRDERDMACILIGHVKVKVFNDPLADPYDQYQFDLQERAANMFYRWADAILFANHKTFTKQSASGEQKRGKGNDFEAKAKVTHGVGGETRSLYTEKRPAHPGGNRYGLPYELPFNYAAFADALAGKAA
jgi:hypothetical protein